MRTTRRSAVLVSGVAVAGLSGCTDVGREPGSSAPSASSTTDGATDGATPDPDPDPDRDALARAVELSSRLLSGLTASGPKIDPGGRLTALHEAHLAALLAATGEDFTTLPTEPAGRLTASRLRRQELKAQQLLARMARTVRSGPLARLLASMSAGIAGALAEPAGRPR